MAKGDGVDETVLIKFAQKLAGNEKKIRDRALKKLRRFLESRSSSAKGAFSEEDFLKIWKGLHYCMWMADKPLVQEELSSNLASLIKSFKQPQQAFLFIDVFFQTESREWFCIDRLRLDKFMMLIRNMVAGSLELIKSLGWKAKFIKMFTNILSKGVVSANSSTPDGLKFHVADTFMSELEKVGADELTPKQLDLFLQPFIHLLVQTRSSIMLRHILKTVFFRIVDYGIEAIMEKEEGGTGEVDEEEIDEEEIDEDEEEIDEDEEEIDEEMDEGEIDEGEIGEEEIDEEEIDEEEIDEDEEEIDEEMDEGEIGEEEIDEEEIDEIDEDDMEERDEFSESFVPLKIDLESLAKKLLELAGGKNCPNQNRKDIYSIVKTYQDLAAGILPAEETLDIEDLDKDDIDYDGAVERLDTFEKKLMQKTGKKRKQKKGDAESAEPPMKKQKRQVAQEEDDAEMKKKKNKFKEEGEKKKKKGKEKMEKKKKKIAKEETPKKPKEAVNIFAGGFFEDDGDEEDSGGVEMMEEASGTFEEHSEEDLEVSFKTSDRESPASKILKKKKGKQQKMKKSQLQKESENSFVQENEEANKVPTSSSKKKSKRKSMEVAVGDSSVITNGDSNTEESQQQSSNDKLGKKKKRKSLGDLEERISKLKILKKAKKLERRKSLGGSTLQTDTVEKTNKQRRKSLGDLESGEVDIWMPNKKYSGQMKSWFQEQQRKSLDSDPTSGEQLVSFTGTSKTPPAFVRRSLDKMSPKAKKSQLSKLDTATETPGSSKKRVSFIMSKNDIRALKSNSVLSPLPKFNPDEKPASPIIKLAENSPVPSPAHVKNLKKLTKINTARNTPKSFPVMHKGKIKGRVKASDFF